MRIEIKNRFNDSVMIGGDFENLREVVVKNKANLWGADLWGAKIKIAQEDDIINGLGIQVED